MLRLSILSSVAVLFLLHPTANAQDGYHSVGHALWHEGFYANLKRNDGEGSCCNLADCRPTQSRIIGDHYEVKVDGDWIAVPDNKINSVIAPDGALTSALPSN
jgi:hypothetical protein